MVLAPKQKYKAMEQDRSPEINHAPMGTLFVQRRQEYTMGQRQPLQ